MNNYHVEPVVNAHCETGENPYWDSNRQLLLWTDIPQGRLYRYDARTAQWDRFYEGPTVGGFTLQADGSLLLFRDNEICRFAWDGQTETLIENIDPDTGRFNDVIADPEGRVFGGTMGTGDSLNGGLYRIDVDGKVTPLIKGTGCSNGMGFSPDLKQFYWTDTTALTIFVFDYDRISGEISNQREFLKLPAEHGLPDGLTIDTAGCIWLACWDGYAVRKYSPDAEPLDVIEFPVAKVSSVTFGGANLAELYATTAGGSDGSDTADGTLYRVRVAAQGRPEFRSRVLLD